jgi:hypothetical protein
MLRFSVRWELVVMILLSLMRVLERLVLLAFAAEKCMGGGAQRDPHEQGALGRRHPWGDLQV